ncbi:MAG: carboxymuconolactone decarboxylase family protein [Thermoplasmata archaeon]
MQPRMPNVVTLFPGVLDGMRTLSKAADAAGVPEKTRMLITLRASQINGCSYCVDLHSREMKEAGEPDERVFAVAAWRESPSFTDAERAALALAESVTRLSDRADPVPDDVWNEAARHYDQRGLASLLLAIAVINVWNRLNVPTRQPATPKSH